MNAWNDLEQIKSEFCIVRFSHSRFSIFMHDLWVCFINHAHHTGAGEWVSRLAYLNLFQTFFGSRGGEWVITMGPVSTDQGIITQNR